ncbi:MAG TPA: hypothetical protein VIX19_08140 [Terriglobales bacterium]
MRPAPLKHIFILGLCLGILSVSSLLTSCSPPGSGDANTKQASYTLPADNYVTPRKIYPYDLKSGEKELSGKTVWVRPGAAQAYYRYGAQGADTKHRAGVLPTLGRLDVKGVVVDKVLVTISGLKIWREQLLAIFTASWQPGEFAVPIATESADSFTFTVNDQFFFEDPHQLYRHWPPEVWAAVDRHEAKQGMNELQVSFALGPEVTSSGDDFGWRWVRYSGNDGPIKVVFKDDQVVKITQESR